VGEERRYSRSHEWVIREGDSARVGVSEFAVEQLGDVVYLELPAVGKQLNRGDVIGDIESVKAVSQLYAPISGEVIAVNEELEAHPELVNEDPLGKGWIVVLQPVDLGDIDTLMFKADYDRFAAEEQA